MSFFDWILSLFLRQNPSVKTAIEEQKDAHTETINVEVEDNLKTELTLEQTAYSLVINTTHGEVAEYRTVENIKLWVRANMTYARYRFPRLIEDIWTEKIGDCTDYSKLIQTLCRVVGITNVKRAHGYFAGEYHDWLVFDDNTIIDGIGDYLDENYEYVGEGFWNIK